MLEEMTLPIQAPLPPVKEGEIFTPLQWETFIAMCEVFVPSISIAGNADVANSIKPFTSESCTPEVTTAYYGESIVNEGLKESLRRRFARHIPASQVQAFAMVLSTLNTRVGSLLMTGGLTPLQSLSIQDRTQVLCGWSQSYLAPLRAIYSSIEAVAKVSWLPVSPTLHKITGFPVVPDHGERKDGFEYKFADWSNSCEKTIHEEYDIVIVGSGCGAGVLAAHLARNTADLNPKPRIAVLEKSYHFPSSHFPMKADAAGENLMEGGGAIQSDDGSIAILAGSTWGGGGTVNWSASLQPQHFVREEWEASGLDFFQSAEFQDCLDTICDRMGVARMNDEEAKSRIPHNFGNTVLLEGARKLGMACEVVPQNTKGEGHWCGYCSEGCAGATKQGPANCWLPDAAKHGVNFIEGCFVEEILWTENTSATNNFVDEIIWTDKSSNIRRRANGLRATWTSRDHKTTKELIISSPRVIISSGTLHSPAILMRSAITNPHLGRNLHLHPTLAIATIWSSRAKPWDGPILTAAVTAFENTDSHGHGPKIEMLAGTPGYMLPWTPWNPHLSLNAIKSGASRTDPNAVLASALDYKTQCAKYAHTAAYIAIQRDRDTGAVYIEPKDPARRQLRIAYSPSKHDRTCMLEGVVATARIAYTMGALEIRPYTYDIPPYVRPTGKTQEEVDRGFKEWVGEVRRIGITMPPQTRFGSAHQMGTCRMGKRKEDGVVDQFGRVWGVKGVYVCDASVFPSASGVNPMVTTMGIAEWIGRAMVRELKGEAKELGGVVH